MARMSKADLKKRITARLDSIDALAPNRVRRGSVMMHATATLDASNDARLASIANPPDRQIGIAISEGNKLGYVTASTNLQKKGSKVLSPGTDIAAHLSAILARQNQVLVKRHTRRRTKLEVLKGAIERTAACRMEDDILFKQRMLDTGEPCTPVKSAGEHAETIIADMLSAKDADACYLVDDSGTVVPCSVLLEDRKERTMKDGSVRVTVTPFRGTRELLTAFTSLKVPSSVGGSKHATYKPHDYEHRAHIIAMKAKQYERLIAGMTSADGSRKMIVARGKHVAMNYGRWIVSHGKDTSKLVRPVRATSDESYRLHSLLNDIYSPVIDCGGRLMSESTATTSDAPSYSVGLYRDSIGIYRLTSDGEIIYQ